MRVYLLPRANWMGSLPVRSVYILSVALAIVQMNMFVRVEGAESIGVGFLIIILIFVDCRY